MKSDYETKDEFMLKFKDILDVHFEKFEKLFNDVCNARIAQALDKLSEWVLEDVNIRLIFKDSEIFLDFKKDLEKHIEELKETLNDA